VAKKVIKKQAVTKSDHPPLDPDWVDQIPEPVNAAVDTWVTAMRAKNKAAEKERNAREECIEKMKEHGVSVIRIDEGAKVLRLVDESKLKTEKAKQPEAAE
jgi:TRAP-type C4-dicarboxylate transport system substrate-binding protein